MRFTRSPRSSPTTFRPLLGAIAAVVAGSILGSLLVAGCGSPQRRRPSRSPRASRIEPGSRSAIFDTREEVAAESDAKRPESAAGAAPAPADDRSGDGADEVLMLGGGAQEKGGGGGAAPVRDPRNPQEALKALEKDIDVRLHEAEYEKRLGDDAFEKADYATAADHYRRALELNPGLMDARERLDKAELILGRRSGRVRSIGRDLDEVVKATEEMRLADARRGLREAEDLLRENDLESIEAAEKKLGTILDELTLYEFTEDISSDLERTKTLLRQAQDRKEQLVREADRSRREKVMGEKERIRKDEERQRRRRVRLLTLKAMDYMRFEKYEQVVQTCRQILKLDPNHRVARYWLREASRNRVDLRKAQILAEDREQMRLNEEAMAETGISWTEPFTFPDERAWKRIQKRKEKLTIVQAEDPEPIRKIKNLLETTSVSFEFQDKPLADVIAFLRQVTGINIDIDPEVLAEDDVTVDLTVSDMKARNALNLILLQTDLASTFEEGILMITKKEKATGDIEFAIYNVSDILNKIRDFQGPELTLKTPGDTETESGGITVEEAAGEDETAIDPDTLQELIKESTGEEAVWGDEERHSMEYHKGMLLVTAPRETHVEIQKVLDNLREDSDLFVMIEARFVDITDDFLEDIGVDARALGLVNNIGIPFGNIINDNRTGGNDLGFVNQGSPVRDVTLIMGQDRRAGRIQHIIDGFTGIVTGERLRGGGIGGLTVQTTWLDPFQLNAILRAVQEKSDVRQLTAPTITAHNGERVYVSVITQRAYIADYELVSGGTGFSIIEVADPVVATFQEGVILDVDPVISHDKKYITLDVRPTMATLIGGIISTILISLGSFTNVAFQVPIGVPEVSLQQTYTSVTVPNGGTVLLGGFKSLAESKFVSSLPILGRIPIIKNIFRRKAEVSEKRSLVILITARIINPRLEEKNRFNTE